MAYDLYIHGDFVERVSYLDIVIGVQTGVYHDLTPTDWGYFSDKGIVKFKEIV